MWTFTLFAQKSSRNCSPWCNPSSLMSSSPGDFSRGVLFQEHRRTPLGSQDSAAQDFPRSRVAPVPSFLWAAAARLSGAGPCRQTETPRCEWGACSPDTQAYPGGSERAALLKEHLQSLTPQRITRVRITRNITDSASPKTARFASF